MSIVDPRSPLALWDVIRYWAWSSCTTWIISHKKIFVGIPELEDLEKSIDAALKGEASSTKVIYTN